MFRQPLSITLFPYTTLFRSKLITNVRSSLMAVNIHITIIELNALHTKRQNLFVCRALSSIMVICIDRKSGSAGMPRTITYAVFCLEKKKKKYNYRYINLMND